MQETNQKNPVAILLIAVIIVNSVIFPTGVGLASFSSAEQSTNRSVSTNATYQTLNFTLESNDSIVHQGESFSQKTTQTLPLNGTKAEASTVYIQNSSSDDSSYDSNDTVVRFRTLHSSIELSSGERYLHKFGKNYLILDGNSNYELDRLEVIFEDKNQDYFMSASDTIEKSGRANLVSFKNTSSRVTYFGANSNNSYQKGDVIISLNQSAEFERGKLNIGKSTVLLKGSAPILGFDDTPEYERVFDVIADSDSVNLNSNESILTSGSSDYVNAGALSTGEDKVLKPGQANLTKFDKNETFIIDAINPGGEYFDGEEAMINDVEGSNPGELDGDDVIVKRGKGFMSEISGNISTYGTGDVFIGSSANSFYGDNEFVYVESGDNTGYQPGEDLVLTGTDGSDPGVSEDSVTKIDSSVETDIYFLDMNQNGYLDTSYVGSADTGSEPIIKTNNGNVSSDGNISTSDYILPAARNNSSYLEIDGNWFEGPAYKDLSRLTGSYNNGTLVYSDQSTGNVGTYDEGELVI